jgi:hypothetical protein
MEEEWADMFMNWVYDSFAEDSYGIERKKWVQTEIERIE